MLKENINLENKCGSCKYFRQLGDTAQGECLKKPYHEEVVHDPAHPHICVARTRKKCPMYSMPLYTNADRIRAMSDEELATWLGVNLDCMVCPVNTRCMEGNGCDKTLLEWLRQPAEVDNEQE